jgi:two-component system, chemotaxis family, chemotaxis protein CheY
MAKFLIVDDDADCRRLLCHYLEPLGECDLAHNGHEAIGAFHMALENQTPYDLICLDLMMPVVSGHRVLHVIRDLEHRRGIGDSEGVKVIVTTAQVNAQQCLQAFRDGCESYLAKPFNRKSLLAQVECLLGEAHERTAF